METFAPLDTNKLSKKYKSEATLSQIFLAEKWMAELKVEHVPIIGNNGHT